MHTSCDDLDWYTINIITTVLVVDISFREHTAKQSETRKHGGFKYLEIILPASFESWQQFSSMMNKYCTLLTA
jgi:hypothetical protein